MATEKKTILRRLWEKMGQPMKADNHLHDTRMFRAAIYGPGILAIALAAVGYLRSPVEADWTLQGFNNFVALFKLPIGVASIAIPLGALIASHHRSIQSASQIDTQRQQNTFSNYINHKEYFGKYLDDEKILNGTHSFIAKDKRVYQALFPHALKGCLDFSFDWVDRSKIQSSISDLQNELAKTSWNCRTNLPEAFKKLDTLREGIAIEFELEIIDRLNREDVEFLYSQLGNLETTMAQLYSASTFFSDSDDTIQLFNWSLDLSKAKNALDEIRDFDFAEKRVKEIAQSALSTTIEPLDEKAKTELLQLLSRNTDGKLAAIRENLSELPTADSVVRQIEQS